MYYIFSTDGRDNTYMEKKSRQNSHVKLGIGRAWDVEVDRISLPYQFTMNVVQDQIPRLYGWYPGSHIMDQRLVNTLQSSGVNNLQTFPVEIHRADTGEEVSGYVVTNIIGRVSCANMESSEYEPLADTCYFHRLVIDPNRTNGLPMFRVHESPMIVLVNEKIAKAIESGGFLGLTLAPVLEAPISA